MNNKWLRAAIPALLIHISVGTVYCWSTFKQTIAEQINMSPFAIGLAFSLAIFFLGMSSAFAGRFVERDIRDAEKFGGYGNEKIDKPDWMRFLANLQAEIDKRGIERWI